MPPRLSAKDIEQMVATALCQAIESERSKEDAEAAEAAAAVAAANAAAVAEAPITPTQEEPTLVEEPYVATLEAKRLELEEEKKRLESFSEELQARAQALQQREATAATAVPVPVLVPAFAESQEFHSQSANGFVSAPPVPVGSSVLHLLRASHANVTSCTTALSGFDGS